MCRFWLGCVVGSQVCNLLSNAHTYCHSLLVATTPQRSCAGQALRSGVHPYHHGCLDLYGCLASASRVAGKRAGGAHAMRWAALAGLLLAGAAESLLSAGAPRAVASLWIGPWVCSAPLVLNVLVVAQICAGMCISHGYLHFVRAARQPYLAIDGFALQLRVSAGT